MRNEMKSPPTGEAGAFGGKREISTTWGLIAIFGAAVLLFGGALTYYYQMSPTTHDYEVSPYVPAKKVSTDATKDWKTYENAKYGFGLIFADEWKGYTIKETETKNPTSRDPLSYLEISVPTTNNIDVMFINIYTPAAYQESLKERDPGSGDLMGKNDSYVFTYYPANGLHGDPDLTFNKTLIPNLAKTFKKVAIDPTADWQTYTNSTYGFNFKYPKDWFADTSNSDSIVIFSNHDKPSQYDKSNAPEDLLQLYVYEYTPDMQTYDQKNLISQATSGNVTILSLRNPEAGADSTDVYNKVGKFTIGGKTFKLGMSSELLPALMVKELTYFDQIVSTFQSKK